MDSLITAAARALAAGDPTAPMDGLRLSQKPEDTRPLGRKHLPTTDRTISRGGYITPP